MAFSRKKVPRKTAGQAAAPTRAQVRQPAAQSRQPAGHKRRKRHKSNHILYYILVLLIAAIVGVVLSVTVFFKIEAITITGTDRYPEEELRRATGISLGDNLFRADLKTAKEALMAYPYVEEVVIKRNYPPEIIVEITQAQPVAALEESAGGYTLLSADGRILELGAALPEGVLPVSGAMLPGKEGDYPARLSSDDEDAEAQAEEASELLLMLTYLREAMEESGLELQSADFSDRYNILARYNENITIEFGSESELARKMKLVREVIDNQIEPGFKGVLYAGTVGKVWADPENMLPEISIPENYVFDEDTGTYVDPAELAVKQQPVQQAEQGDSDDENAESDSDGEQQAGLR